MSAAGEDMVASTEIVALETRPPDLSGASLDDLARTANREHHFVVEAALQAIVHAIRCGDALLEARKKVPAGGWGQWVDNNLEVKRSTAQQYMRLAGYREKLLESKVPLTIETAMAYLSSEPPLFPSGGHNKAHIPDDVLDEARQLRTEGMSWHKIAEKFNLRRETIQQRLDPEYQRRSTAATRRYRRKQRAAMAALERQQRDEAVKKSGGSPASAYSLIRRALAELDRALAEAVEADADEDTRSALRAAMSYSHRAEDEIVRALKLERGGDGRRRPDKTRTSVRGLSGPDRNATARARVRDRLTGAGQ